MARIRMLVAATSAALVVALPGGPAQSLAPLPVAGVPLPVALDNAAFYEAQTICDPTPRPGSTALKNLLVATYGPATVYIPRACTSSTSEHFDGRAVDWMRSARVPAEKEMADSFVSWLLAPAKDGTPHAMARRLGIMYIIWNNRMIRMYDPGRGWTNYRNCLDPANAGAGLDNSCHRNHVHLSMSWDGAAGLTSWWSGVAQTQPYCPSRTTSAAPGPGTPALVGGADPVPGGITVERFSVIDTSRGSGGGLGGPCRVLAGRSVYPSVVGTGQVPATARAVVVSVRSSSNAPARLAVWSSGAPRPLGQVETPIGTTTASVLVPLSSDGTIALGTSLGAANIAAEVVGYVPGGSPEVVVPQPEPKPAVARAPSKPRSVKASSAGGVVRTSWTKPLRTGGSPVTGYRVEALTSAAKGATVAGRCRVSATRRSCSISGLKKGTTYWMSVSVSNSVGRTWAPRKKVRVR